MRAKSEKSLDRADRISIRRGSEEGREGLRMMLFSCHMPRQRSDSTEIPRELEPGAGSCWRHFQEGD